MGINEVNLAKIDNKATQKAVEAILEKYRIMCYAHMDIVPAVTPAYKLTPPTTTNAFHSTTEDAAINNVDYEMHKRKFIDNLMRAINKLTYQERRVIVVKYMGEEELFNYEASIQLGMSERSFYRIRNRAFYKIALSMQVEVYEEEVKGA